MEKQVNRHIKLLKIWIVQGIKTFQMTKGKVQKWQFLWDSALEKQLKMESDTIIYIRKEINCKQTTIKKLLQTLTVCLKRESLIRDDNIFFSCWTLKLIQTYKTLINQNFLLLKIIKQSMLTMPPFIKVTENQFMIILTIVPNVIKSLTMNYLIQLQLIIAKIKAGLIRIASITLVV